MDAGALGVYSCLFLALYFEVFLLITFLEKRPATKKVVSLSRHPTVCIMVPCWNEEKTLGKTLSSLLELDYPKDKLSILVIDDGSTDGTSRIAKEYVASNPQVKYLHQQNGGKYTAMNLGLANTDAELIGCLDADSFVEKHSLKEMVNVLLEDSSVMATTPIVKVFQPRNMLEHMQTVEYTLGIFYKKMFHSLSAILVIPGPFPIYRREMFDRIGTFRHAHNTEDLELTLRMHANGLKIANVHTAVVHTTVPTTVGKLIKQRTRWSKGFLQNARDYSFMFFNPDFGNFGMLVLPSSALFFVSALFLTAYALYSVIKTFATRAYDLYATGIPLQMPSWQHILLHYINPSFLLFLVMTTSTLLITMMILGQRIAETPLAKRSYLSYFALFSFIAPIWLAKAAWGAMRAQNSSWR